jgi:hypothetical protein
MIPTRSPRRANEFAATTTQSPPARTAMHIVVSPWPGLRQARITPARQGQSAQADFAHFQRRIHSLVWRAA